MIKKLLDSIFNNHHSIIENSSDLAIAVNKMVKTIEDNYESAFCTLPIKTDKEKCLLCLETVLYYRVLAQLMLTGISQKHLSNNDVQKCLMDFSYNVDDTIAKHLQEFSPYFSRNDYIKYYYIRRLTYANYVLELAAQSALPEFSPDMFNRLSCLLCIFNELHCYMIQKTGAMINDDYIFRNSRQLLLEHMSENTKERSGKILEMDKSMKDMVVYFIELYNKARHI